MGVLDSVLAYKAQKDAQARADIDAIPLGIKAFTDAKQTAQKNMLDQLTYNMALSKFNMDAQKQPYEIDKLKAETFGKQAETSALNSFLNGGGSSGGTQASEATIGGIKYIKPELVKQEQQKKNEMAMELETQKQALEGSGSDSGRVALAKESIKNLDDVIATLYPDGTPESFDREIAFSSNLPGVSIPFFGRVTPQVRPDNPLDKSDDVKSQKAQDVFRKVGASLSGRQLIQTGVAARPEETAKLVSQFAPRLTANPQAGLSGLLELKDFYKSYLQELDPKGVKGVNKTQPETNKTPNEIKAPEGLKLPTGHKIIAVRKSNGK